MSASASARSQILAKLRAAPAGPKVPAPELDGWLAGCHQPDSAAAFAQHFAQALLAARAEVHRVDVRHWVSEVVRVLAAKGVRRLLLGAAGEVADAMVRADAQGMTLLRYEEPVRSWLTEMFDSVDAALTGAQAGVADTGSVVLWPDANEPRLMSLVPPIHAVVLDATQMCADLSAVMQRFHWAQGMPTNAVLVSGPSKTADIQQTLAYGAHGPKELVVFLRGTWPEQKVAS
jgi:L-lactate dehydrogenase complex protein LldG